MAIGVSKRASIRLVVGVALIAQLLVVQISMLAPDATAAADRIITNGEHFPNGFVVPEGQTWAFDPGQSTSITVGGNVDVRGRLEMKPVNRSVNHAMTFLGIDERRMVGAIDGQVVPVATDVGLWVLGEGVLDLQGTEKTPWDYTYDPAWAGDEVRAAPTAPGDYTSFPTVTSTPAANALGYRAELLNLTRNVTIQGTQSGKSHIFIRSARPQTIRFVALRWMAPDIHKSDARRGTSITGRYALHFHHSMDGARGSLVEGVVVRDADNHAFVPHHSHGITFRDTIAYNTVGEAYWWDETTAALCGAVPDCNVSHDTLYDGVVAAMTHTSPYDKHESGAIQLGSGNNNAVINSVAVGFRGGGMNNSGFKWPSKERGFWRFENNIAHNNDANGAWIWHNGSLPHVANGFLAYHNRKAGVDHGAYANAFVWQNLTLLGNGVAIESHAMGSAAAGVTDTQRWDRIDTRGTGVMAPKAHNNGGTNPVRFTHCDLDRIVFDELGSSGGTKSTARPGYYDFIECGLQPSDFDFSGASNDSVVRVQDGATAYRLTGTGAMTTITTFAPVNPPLPALPPPPRRNPESGTVNLPPPSTTTTTVVPTTTRAPTTTTRPDRNTTTTRPRDRDTTTTTRPSRDRNTTTTRPRDRDRDTTTTRGRGELLAAGNWSGDPELWNTQVPPEEVFEPYFCTLV